MLALVIIPYLVIAIAVAIVATRRGRSGVGWFLVSVGLSPLIAILLLIALPARVVGYDDVALLRAMRKGRAG